MILSKSDLPTKRFKLDADKITQLVKGYGYCYATDMITVDGKQVGYMYREEPDNTSDNGWRFFSGLESQNYVDDPNNSMLYLVNTIANYDPEIIEFLDSPYGSEFERDQNSQLVRIST